jgi:chloramphenicol-sensitive protein RarD
LHHAPDDHERARGLLAAGSCYLLWGLVPLYWKQLAAFSAYEVIAHRTLWSAVVLLALLRSQRGIAALWTAMQNRRELLHATQSALLLGANWLLYVMGTNTGHVTECSLGYFLVPLVSVAAGRLLLHERLRPGQWTAVAIAALGVVWLTGRLERTPWFALGLAASWGLYGLMRKRSTLGSLLGLCLETLLAAPIALVGVLWLLASGQGAFAVPGTGHWLLLASTGLVTALPLLLFGYGARRLPLSTLGLLQYIAPSVQFVLGVLVYDEAFGRDEAIGFCAIWLGLGVFTIEGLLRRRTRRG